MFSAKCRRDFAAYTKQAWYEAEQRSSYGGNGSVKKVAGACTVEAWRELRGKGVLGV